MLCQAALPQKENHANFHSHIKAQSTLNVLLLQIMEFHGVLLLLDGETVPALALQVMLPHFCLFKRLDSINIFSVSTKICT